MAFRDDEILESLAEDTGREDLHSPYAKAGLDYAVNPGRSTFKQKISLRPIPDFTKDDFELRIVVAQTAYSHFRRSVPWQRVPETLTIDPPQLAKLIAERLEQQSKSRPDFLSRFNTTKDYVACLSAVAYLHWRVGWRHQEIADYLRISKDMVRELNWRMRVNAARLGMPVKCWLPPKALLSRSEAAKKAYEKWPELRERQSERGRKNCEKRWARPGERQRFAADTKKRWANDPERRRRASERAKAMNLQRFLKTVAYA